MLDRLTAVATVALLGVAMPQLTVAQPHAQNRHFVIAAVEPKGGVTTDREPFPAKPVPKGAGYVLKEPDASGRWEMSAYMWMPSQIIVNQGDEVTLEFVGINGSHHPTTIAGYDKFVEVRRGHVTRLSFKADKAGVFAITCDIHRPSMVGELVVVSRP